MLLPVVELNLISPGKEKQEEFSTESSLDELGFEEIHSGDVDCFHFIVIKASMSSQQSVAQSTSISA